MFFLIRQIQNPDVLTPVFTNYLADITHTWSIKEYIFKDKTVHTLSGEDEIIYKCFHFFSRERKRDCSLIEFHIIFRKFKKTSTSTSLLRNLLFWRLPGTCLIRLPTCTPALFLLIPTITKAFSEPVPTPSLLSFHFMLLIHLQRIHIHVKVIKNTESEHGRFYHNFLSFICTQIHTDEAISQQIFSSGSIFIQVLDTVSHKTWFSLNKQRSKETIHKEINREWKVNSEL